MDKMDKKSMRKAYGNKLVELASNGSDIFVVDADLGSSLKTGEFSEKFPERYMNVGIREQSMPGIALGLALNGYNVFINTFSVFVLRELEQIFQIDYTQKYNKNVNITVVGSHGGIATGEDGPTHQGISDIGAIRSIPYVRIVAPCDAVETENVLETIVNGKEKGINYLRLVRPDTPVVFDKNKFEFGKSSVLRKHQHVDYVVFSYGYTLHECLEASDDIKDFNVDVVNVSSIRPFDDGIILRYGNKKELNGFVVVEDHYKNGGLGDIVSNTMVKAGIRKKFLHIALDGFAESGTTSDLYKKYGLDSDSIKKRIEKL